MNNLGHCNYINSSNVHNGSQRQGPGPKGHEGRRDSLNSVEKDSTLEMSGLGYRV